MRGIRTRYVASWYNRWLLAPFAWQIVIKTYWEHFLRAAQSISCAGDETSFETTSKWVESLSERVSFQLCWSPWPTVLWYVNLFPSDVLEPYAFTMTNHYLNARRIWHILRYINSSPSLHFPLTNAVAQKGGVFRGDHHTQPLYTGPSPPTSTCLQVVAQMGGLTRHPYLQQ